MEFQIEIRYEVGSKYRNAGWGYTLAWSDSGGWPHFVTDESGNGPFDTRLEAERAVGVRCENITEADRLNPPTHEYKWRKK
ncbi:hypothetical protein [Streptomyces hokutonensis]|uniref:hypothetical protein n=1 Tax=Streptomyces hokutonensis TaxID=1306990 RepID=UPI000361270F|nr:hypothetical protein [Streptomyces hokutonensis]